METRPETGRTRRGPLASYAVVLLGAALFVASCFLPYYVVGLGDRNEGVTMYDQLRFGADGWVFVLGTFLFLFGALAVLAAIAIVGLVRRGDPLWNPAMLAVVALAWSLTSFGTLLRATAFVDASLPAGLSLDVGFWVQAISVLVVILGTMGLLITARRAAAREPDPSAGP